ncbi:MAG: SCO6745 family protein [Frankia sp.]
MDPSVSRRTWRTLEPVAAMVYFVPEAQEEYAALGLDVKGNRAVGYFPARAAAMGAVSVGTVQATFFNFSRRAVEFGMTGVWESVTPEAVLAARCRGADRALRRLAGDEVSRPAVGEALELARAACAGASPYGRPLYAAHADLPWPDAPHVALWHAITLLREYRGDGHIAALVGAGYTGLEAAVTHAAQADLWSKDGLRTTRAYSKAEWQHCVDDLRARGELDADERLTPAGAARRSQVEDLTDVLAQPAWEKIGADGCARLRDLVRPLATAVVAGGGFPLKGEPSR